MGRFVTRKHRYEHWHCLDLRTPLDARIQEYREFATLQCKGTVFLRSKAETQEFYYDPNRGIIYMDAFDAANAMAQLNAKRHPRSPAPMPIQVHRRAQTTYSIHFSQKEDLVMFKLMFQDDIQV